MAKAQSLITKLISAEMDVNIAACDRRTLRHERMRLQSAITSPAHTFVDDGAPQSEALEAKRDAIASQVAEATRVAALYGIH